MNYHKTILFSFLVLWLGSQGVVADNLVRNGSFENGSAPWSAVDGEQIKVERGGGRNQTSGLKYTRLKPEDYHRTLVRTELPKPQPGVKYHFGGWVRPVDLEGTASVCVEVSQDGKYLYGIYANEVRGGQTDWQPIEASFITQGEDPADCNYVLTVYLRPEATGTVWFDDIFMEEDQPEWLVSQAWPTHESISSRDGKIELNSYFFGQFVPADDSGSEVPLTARLTLKAGDQVLAERQVPVENQRIKAVFGRLPEGDANLSVVLQTPDNPAVAERQLPVTISAAGSPEGSSCFIDEYGRAVVDGEPFMPLGLYLLGVVDWDLDLIAEGPFNTVMPYAILDKSSFEEIDAIMDHADALNLKVIFSLKDLYPPGVSAASLISWNGIEGDENLVRHLVGRLKTHPALLAWYICDESAREQLPALIKRRRLINELDPNHPTWAVFFQRSDLPYYLPSLDVLGVDPYPIYSKDRRDMVIVDQMGRQTDRIATAYWAVPQAHNIGHYDAEAANDLNVFQEKFRYPTEHEMLANCILQAIYNAKGFILYSYFDLYKGPEEGQFDRRWPEVCRVGDRLKSLQEFILSNQAGPAVKVTTADGLVRARCLTDGNGNYRLLIAGVEAGWNRAEVEIAGEIGPLHSTSGHTRALGNGKYLFEAENISCDILE